MECQVMTNWQFGVIAVLSILAQGVFAIGVLYAIARTREDVITALADLETLL